MATAGAITECSAVVDVTAPEIHNPSFPVPQHAATGAPRGPARAGAPGPGGWDTGFLEV